jgi:transposase
MTSHPVEERVYIKEAAQLLNRRMDTLRRWDGKNELPKHLRPYREPTGRRWRYWTKDQIEGIKQWMKDTDRRPGKGLPYYDPDEAQVEKQLEAMRKPRKKSNVTSAD